MALFITFEGGEGSGKSTQAKLLLKKLQKHNIPAVLTHEPGGTALGNKLRSVIKGKQGMSIAPGAELFLFAASRVQLVAELIRPALEQGKVVICDRFVHSTLVYQGYGRGLDLTVIEMVNKIATQNLRPDLTILLDISPEQGLMRRHSLEDRFEQEALSFHCSVEEGYVKLAAVDPDHWLVIDASLPKQKIAETIWETVSKLLPNFSA
ncbi:MAG: dTMP kinase [Dehalococcoidia bacterium]